jgi:hypothetical protein
MARRKTSTRPKRVPGALSNPEEEAVVNPRPEEITPEKGYQELREAYYAKQAERQEWLRAKRCAPGSLKDQQMVKEINELSAKYIAAMEKALS